MPTPSTHKPDETAPIVSWAALRDGLSDSIDALTGDITGLRTLHTMLTARVADSQHAHLLSDMQVAGVSLATAVTALIYIRDRLTQALGTPDVPPLPRASATARPHAPMQ